MPHDGGAVSLTDLCAICHVNPIKYTCPRDGIHTCSLPCVKRHKQWAQCSGVRNPAEYRKRFELATEASIDKDFNFITKVERAITQADNVVADRGIDLVPARFRPRDARPKFELEAEANNIKVIKAPKGLSRSKQNKTHWGGQSKCIVWTVEWLCQDGRRIMSAASEDQLVKDLFEHAAGKKRSSRKRKRPMDAEKSLHSSTVNVPQASLQTNNEDTLALTVSEMPALADAKQIDEEVEADTNLDLNTLQPTPEVHFYLHRPNTESRFKCLIPISPTTSLREILRDRTILEYPTIHVRQEPPDELQPPFIVEAEYIQRHGTDIPINVTATNGDAAEEDIEDGELTTTSEIPDSINELKVLEVLAKDLAS